MKLCQPRSFFAGLWTSTVIVWRAISGTFAGPDIVLVGQPGTGLRDVAIDISKTALAVEMDITEDGAADCAIMVAISRFGGLDVLVSNGGAVQIGAMLDMDDQLLFKISKQLVNPGRDFGVYGLPKTSTLFLMRQLAIELGGDHIRLSGVNADQIRFSIVIDEFIASRSSARGIEAADYMATNLLRREVEARHVAEAFLMPAQMERTTGHVMTVDGGIVEASLG